MLPPKVGAWGWREGMASGDGVRGWRQTAGGAQSRPCMRAQQPLARRRSPALAKPPNPQPIGRLQRARRLYQVLVREIDHAIEVERLLTDARYARDVLLVCDALPGSEAPPLATQFRALPPPAAGVAARPVPTGAPGHAQQPTDWSRDTSGFGVTRPPRVAPLGSSRPRAAEAPDGPPAVQPAKLPAEPVEEQAGRRRSWLARWRDSR